MKKLIRSRFIPVFAIIAGLLIAGCSGKSENNIVGKWKTSQGGDEATITFTKDGKVIDEEGGKPQSGEYSFSSPNTITMKMPNPAPGNGGNKDDISVELTVQFTSSDEVILTPKSMGGIAVPAGSIPPAKFTRVK
jgi:hypothetical protein